MKKQYTAPKIVTALLGTKEDMLILHECSVTVHNSVSTNTQLSKSNNSFFDDSEEEED